MNKRLEQLKRFNIIPFDLGFLRELGYGFEEDWDGQLVITQPEDIDIKQVTEIIKQFHKTIKKRLYFERCKAHSVCVGGPMNGKSYGMLKLPNEPILFHISRCKWAVYSTKDYDDPRAWFVGIATSEKKARQLRLIEK